MDSLINRFSKIADADVHIFKILAEKKKFEDEISKKKEVVLKTQKDYQILEKQYLEKKKNFEKEEKFLKEERDKISSRRKGLGSLNNYKVQQAAEKELDISIKEINEKEEKLLETLSAIDQAGEQSAKQKNKLKTLETELLEVENRYKELNPSFEERLQKFSAIRQELIHGVDEQSQLIYERARSKFPLDPVVSINEEKCCTGCFMQVQPQVLVQASKGTSLVKCAGCVRILFIKE